MSGSSFSLFGSIAHLNPQIALIVFICLIVSLILIESVLHLVEHEAKIAGYEELVNRLYRELALMGCIGFGVLVTFTAFPLDHGQNYYAFEFAHITTFFIAIFLCLRAIFVVYNARAAAQGLWKAHNISAKELSKLHDKAMVSWSLQGILYRYLGILSPLRRWVEYTVIEEYFHRHFCLSRTEFRFVDYLTRSYQMYAISLTEISPYSWGVIILLALLNYTRIRVMHSPHHICRLEHDSGHSSTDSSTDDHHDSYPTPPPSSHSVTPHMFFGTDDGSHSDDGSHGDDHGGGHGDDDGLQLTTACANYEMNYFLFCGGLLTLLIAIIAYITWHSECKLLEIAMTRLTRDNYGKHSNYGKILKALAILDEKKAIFAQQKSNIPLNIYQQHTQQQDHQQEVNDISGQGSAVGLVSGNSSIKPEEVFDEDIRELLDDESNVYHIVTLRLVLKDMKHDEEVEHIKSEYERKEFFKKIYHNLCCCFVSLHNENEFENKKYRITELKEKERKLESLENIFRTTSGRQGAGGGDGMSLRGHSVKRVKGGGGGGGVESVKRVLSMESVGGAGGGSLGGGDDDENEVYEHELMKETNQVFVFSNRHIYKTMIEISLMLFALYTSLWVSHFILISSASSAHHTYLIIVSCSIIFIFLLISYIQYHSNMILSVTSLRNENAEWICNQDYIKSKTIPLLQNEIKVMLSKLGKSEFEDAIKEIFYLVNMDGDEKILLDEFATLLYTLDIHLTHAETRVLFRSMDMDGNGSISLEELRELLLDDSILISKKTEHVNPKLVKLKSRSSLDTFQRLVAKEIIVDAAAEALMQDDDDQEAGHISITAEAKSGTGTGAGGGKKIEEKMDYNSDGHGLEIQSLSPANSSLSFSSSKKINYSLASAAKIVPEVGGEAQAGSLCQQAKEGNDANV